MADISAEHRPDLMPRRGLDATINLAQVSWSTIAWVAVLAVGSGLRLFQLGLSSLSPAEARNAFDAWSLITGATEGPYRDPSHVAPSGLLLRTLLFFLFGESDTTVRLVSALLGIGLIAMIWAARDLIGDLRALSAAALVALSPTVVFASRSANDAIISAFFGFALVLTVFRLGQADQEPGIGRVVALGFLLAGLIGSGPAGLTVLLVLIATFGISPLISQDRGDAVQRAITRLLGSHVLLAGFVIACVITLVTLFTRFYSDPEAISGLADVFADWGRMIASQSSDTPTQFFIFSLLLYEIVAIVFAVKAAMVDTTPELERTGIDWSYPAVWFLASLVLFSFSSGRQPEHTVLIVFPLLLLAGFGLGDAIQTLVTTDDFGRRTGLLALTVFGATIALISTLVLVGRVDDAANKSDAMFGVFAAAVVALGPMIVLAYTLADQLGRTIGWRSVRAAVLLGVAGVLAVLTIRSTVELSFYRIAAGNELLAQDIAVTNLRDIAHRTANLSRDINGGERSPSNPAGGKEMTIAIDRTVQWPFRWYFRDFPNMQVTAPGDATTKETQLVIAPDATGMTEAGYQPRTVETRTSAPAAYLEPSLGTVLEHIFVPSNWDEGLQFLLYRKGIETSTPRTVSFGYTGVVVSRMTGERPIYKLFDHAGAGSNPGQFDQPRAVALSSDGSRVYVLDTLNGRVEVFTAETGEFLAIWGDGEGDDVNLTLTENGLGPYGMASGPEGLVFVADTWNHRIVVVDPDGQVVRTFGENADNQDSADPQVNVGMFYGPRDLAIFNNEVYVTDTGNERVEVFGLDGSFHRAWGGKGSAENQLIEPVGIAIDSDGKVYVADSGNARISVFDSEGQPIEQWPITEWQGQQFYEPYLAIDQSGLVYASSPNTASILVIGTDGTVQSEILDAEGVPLQLPAGMTISDSNQLYIADRGSSEIYMIELGPAEATTSSGEEITELPAGTPGTPAATPEATPDEGSPPGSG